ncbi:MAG: hypothetical protein KUG81_07840 [Gammaproteobacteria bacterium]|nr:hypothetical protein [Gammaproteobacteria bacterium]
MPTKIDGQYFFTTEEQDELQGYFDTSNWSEAYRRTAEILDVFWEDEQITQAKLWFEGAYLVNTGQGGFSDLIRYYTQRQGQLHFGEAEGAGSFVAYGGDMQLASDEVARRALESILTNKDNREGQVPLLSQLAKNDATAVGNVLFARDTADTAFANNAAWSGTPLFSMLGSDQTGLLLRGRDGDTSEVFDTIEDLRNLIFMVDAFDYAVEQAKASWAGLSTGFETFFEQNK